MFPSAGVTGVQISAQNVKDQTNGVKTSWKIPNIARKHALRADLIYCKRLGRLAM